jgi:acyl-coenzyme A thioesterase PaaI-like protein
MRASTFRRLLNLWPPFLFNSIRLTSLSDDYSEASVVLRLRPWNRNYVRSQFGGNLFAMVDPFWMLLAMRQLGNDYIVWDKAGTIDFVAPGREDVYAHFKLTPTSWMDFAPKPPTTRRCCAGSRPMSPPPRVT